MKHNRLVTYTKRALITFDFYGNEELPYVYVPIFKNAHTFGKNYFKAIADFNKTENWQGKKQIVFLRDPYERWVSAVCQWFVNNLPDKCPTHEIDPLMMKMIFSAIRLDGHGELQSDIVDLLDVRNIIFFNIDDPMFDFNLKHFTHHTLKKRFSKKISPKENERNLHPLKAIIEKQIRDYANANAQEKQNILGFYQRDSELFKNARFYKVV